MPFKKAQAVSGFPFCLVNKQTGAAISSGTVDGHVTKDGGTQAALGGSATHEGNGQWSWSTISADEMNGDLVGLLFIHADAVPVHFTIKTETKLVSELNDVSTAQVNAEVDQALVDYDPPTKTELDAGLAGLNDVSAAEVNAQCDTALVNYDGPTKTEFDAGLAGLFDDLTKVGMTVVSPVSADGDVTLYEGNDYTGANALEIPLAGWTGHDVDGAPAVARFLAARDYLFGDTDKAALELPASKLTVAQSGTDVTVTIKISATDLASLATSPPLDERRAYRLQVIATPAGKGPQTVVDAWFALRRMVDAPAP